MNYSQMWGQLLNNNLTDKVLNAIKWKILLYCSHTGSRNLVFDKKLILRLFSFSINFWFYIFIIVSVSCNLYNSDLQIVQRVSNPSRVAGALPYLELWRESGTCLYQTGAVSRTFLYGGMQLVRYR